MRPLYAKQIDEEGDSNSEDNPADGNAPLNPVSGGTPGTPKQSPDSD